MKTIVKQIEAKEISCEVLAQEIVAISAGIKKLRESRLNEDALILLIQNSAPTIKSGQGCWQAPKKLTAKVVKSVLNGIEHLEETYLKPKKVRP